MSRATNIAFESFQRRPAGRPLIHREPRSYRNFLRGPNKYGAYKAIYNGREYDSRMEALHAARLDTLMKATDPKERVVSWTPQVRIPFVVNGRHVCDYICDFVVTYGDGRVQYEEVKGKELPVWRLKEKLFRALYPDRVLKVIRS